MRRRRMLAAAGGVLVTGFTGFAVITAAQARTPAQRAAQAAPPPPSTITAPVRRGRLADRTVLDGVLARDASVRVAVPRIRAVTRLVVTREPLRAGAVVARGDVVAEVSGRPVIALTGKFPAYRELSRGAEGTDVRQLRAALRPLYGTATTGPFDNSVENALTSLYRERGYRPVRRAGRTVLPVGEIAFVPTLPATVAQDGPEVGTQAAGTLLTLAAGRPTVVAPVPPDAQAALDGGGVWTFGAGPLDGRPTTLISLRDRDGAQGQEAVFRVDGPAELDTGQEVILTRGAADEETLIVPVAALWTAPDGAVTVTVVEGEDQRSVPVRVRRTVLGESAVTGELTERDVVLVAAR